MGLAETLLLITVLVLVAMVLIVAEICTPTFGVLAVAAVVAVGWAVYLVFAQFGQTAGMAAVVGAIVLLPVYTVAAIRILPRTALGRRIGLSHRKAQAGEGTPEAADLSRYVGRTTTADTSLRPSGFVRIDGRRVVAEAEAGMIIKGRKVKVIRAGGTSVTVREIESPAEAERE